MDNKAFREDYEELKGKADARRRTKTGENGSGGISDSGSSVVIETVKMKRTVGLVSGTSLIVGTIIGSGIFISPKGVLEQTGSVGLSLVVWVVAGLLALLGSLCYAELGTLVRKSGGEYAYLKEAFGDIPAFLFAWTSIIVIRTSSIAIICLTFASYMVTFFPYCGSPAIPMKLVAALVIITISIVNAFDTRMAANMQVFFTGAKLIALGIISVGGIVRLAQGHVLELNKGFEGTVSNPSIIALAFYQALWAYDGWNNLNYVTEEIQNPQKNLPRANVIAILLVTCVYLLTNISYLTAMTAAELLDSEAVAVTWGERVLGVAHVIMPLSVLFSTFGAANGSIFTGGRLVYCAGRDGNMPQLLSFIHCTRYTPVPSIIFTAIISLLMIIPGDVGSLVDFFSFSAWIFYGCTVASLLVMRYTKRNEERPVKVPIVIPILFVLIAIYLVIGPLIENPRIEFLYAFLFMIGGLIFYFPLVYFKLQLKWFDRLTTVSQLFFEVAPSPYEPED